MGAFDGSGVYGPVRSITPEFNRACAINGIDTSLNWMMRKYNPLGR